MLPTIDMKGEIGLENMFYYRIWPFQRGDLVTLASPSDPSRIICKRIIGLPGDTVCVDPTGLRAPSTEHVVVPKGHLWLVGDNATLARDSRDYGPTSMALIRGRLIARVNKDMCLVDSLLIS
jgi:inner membrane protease subunit 1